jgi:hypothetical protein
MALKKSFLQEVITSNHEGRKLVLPYILNFRAQKYFATFYQEFYINSVK